MKASNKGKRFPAEPLTPDEVRALINACSRKSATGIRNRALLAVLYRTGLRISEALSLRIKDLDQSNATIRVLCGKGKRARLVGLDPGAWAILQLWLDRRGQLKLNPRARLFCTLAGESIKTPYVRVLLPRLAKKAGIAKRVHPHGLRHTFAFELAGEGVAMHIIQAQLGHAHLSTTAIDVSHLNPKAVVEQMRQRAWCL